MRVRYDAATQKQGIGFNMVGEDQKLKVLSNYLPYRKPLGNTDHEYMEKVKELEEVDSNVTVFFNRHVLANAICDAGFYVKRVGDKLGITSDLRKALHWKTMIFPRTARNADVVFSRLFFPNRVLNKIPIVYHSGFPTDRYAGASDVSERRNQIRSRVRRYRQTAATIFSTREGIDRFLDVAPADLRDKITYAPYFLPSVEPVNDARIEQKFSDADRIRVLFVGTDGRRKGIHNFLKAVDIACNEYPDLRSRLHVAAVTKSEVERQDFQLEHHRYLEHERLLKEFREAHVFCMPTRRDVYGLVYIEAMASGCAIIADDSSVRKEILDDGKAGLLSDPFDPEDIAKKLVALAHSPKRSKKLAMRAMEKFKQCFYWKVVGKKYVELLRSAAEQGS